MAEILGELHAEIEDGAQISTLMRLYAPLCKYPDLAVIARELLIPAGARLRARGESILATARRDPSCAGLEEDYFTLIDDLRSAATLFVMKSTPEIAGEYRLICAMLSRMIDARPEFQATWRLLASERAIARARPPPRQTGVYARQF